MVEVSVNEGAITAFPPSLEAAETLREMLGIKGSIKIRQKIHPPIGTGFGTSAAAAMGVVLALSKVAGRGMTLREACRITHEIELRCRTGLNSEVGIMAGGLVLVVREGAPPRSLIDTIPLPSDARLVAVVAGAMETPSVLKRRDRLREVEAVGDKRLEEILRKPTPENFLHQAREFAYEAGLVTREVEEIFEAFSRLPLIGYAQNMLGRAGHGLVRARELPRVEATLRETFPDYEVVVSEIGYGVRASLDA